MSTASAGARGARPAPDARPRAALGPAVVAALLVAAACGGDEDPAPPPNPNTGSAPATAAPRPDGGAGAVSAAGPWFEDATEAWGLDFVHVAGFTPEKHLPETMGAGAALADLDADGDLDLYLVQGGPDVVAGACGAVAGAPPNRTFANRGDGRLVDATGASGDAADRGYGMGVAAGDASGDGSVDLYVTNLGPDVLLLNDGAARFTRPADNGGIDDPRWTAGATFVDADLDGDLDLYVTAYLAVDLEHPIHCGRREPGWRSYCHPDRYAGLQDRFWRNEGGGRFVDGTAAAGLVDETGDGGKGLGVFAADFDDDGDADLYVANDSVENRFWRNRGDGTFADDTLLTGTGVNGDGATEAGMGLAAGDVDGDGDAELLVSNLDHESNTLYRNEGGVYFVDATRGAGLDAPSRMLVGFGLVLEDFDLDGDLDLAVANGHIIDNIALYDDGQSWAQPAQLFVNDGAGRFRQDDAAAGDLARTPFVARGLYRGDLDGDGRPDLLLTQCGREARLYRNVARGGSGAVLRGLAAGSRVSAVLPSGARVVRATGGGSSYCGTGSPELFLGWGAGAAPERVEVRAPGGEAESLSLDEALRRFAGARVR